LTEGRRQLVLRVAFLAALAGGLLLWARARTPKDLQLIIDLTDALPGEITEIDVVVTRAGRALLRSDRRFALGQAPQRVHLEVRAAPGAAEVEATVLGPGKPARREQGTVQLAQGEATVLKVR
jgi:hypothetical protein